jgi:hypothetical protein
MLYFKFPTCTWKGCSLPHNISQRLHSPSPPPSPYLGRRYFPAHLHSFVRWGGMVGGGRGEILQFGRNFGHKTQKLTHKFFSVQFLVRYTQKESNTFQMKLKYLQCCQLGGLKYLYSEIISS